MNKTKYKIDMADFESEKDTLCDDLHIISEDEKSLSLAEITNKILLIDDNDVIVQMSIYIPSIISHVLNHKNIFENLDKNQWKKLLCNVGDYYFLQEVFCDFCPYFDIFDIFDWNEILFNNRWLIEYKPDVINKLTKSYQFRSYIRSKLFMNNIKKYDIELYNSTNTLLMMCDNFDEFINSIDSKYIGWFIAIGIHQLECRQKEIDMNQPSYKLEDDENGKIIANILYYGWAYILRNNINLLNKFNSYIDDYVVNNLSYDDWAVLIASNKFMINYLYESNETLSNNNSQNKLAKCSYYNTFNEKHYRYIIREHSDLHKLLVRLNPDELSDDMIDNTELTIKDDCYTNDIIDLILKASNNIKTDRNVSDIFIALIEEIGEISNMISKTHITNSYKFGKESNESLISECCDAIICLVDLINKDSQGEITHEQLYRIVKEKLNKWYSCVNKNK